MRTGPTWGFARSIRTKTRKRPTAIFSARRCKAICAASILWAGAWRPGPALRPTPDRPFGSTMRRGSRGICRRAPILRAANSMGSALGSISRKRCRGIDTVRWPVLHTRSTCWDCAIYMEMALQQTKSAPRSGSGGLRNRGMSARWRAGRVAWNSAGALPLHRSRRRSGTSGLRPRGMCLPSGAPG